MLLSDVPHELQSIILSQLDTRALACLAATCRSLWCDVSLTLLTPGLVETELRRRTEARGLHIGSSLPNWAVSWVSYLLKRDLYGALRREAPLAVGCTHSMLVDREGRLHLACRRAEIRAGRVGEPLLGHDSVAGTSIVSVPPTLVPSMQDKRVVSVATGVGHCLALCAEGGVYSWGTGAYGALGHADGGARAGPRRVDALAHVESIAAGIDNTSAAVDDRGRLFTWSRARRPTGGPTGLGYELDPEIVCQIIPRRVDALSEDRVVCVALGNGFTLAVTDAGAVFSFGFCAHDALGHGKPPEVLPRRIEALAQTGQRFVAVAAGDCHALALTEEGHIYGWGHWEANGHGRNRRTPQLVTMLAEERVKLVYAQGVSSCAVTEKDDLYTWGRGSTNSFNLGHGAAAPHPRPKPKRVEALRRVKVAAAAACGTHTLVVAADAGVVWSFGERSTLGLGNAAALPGCSVKQPAPYPYLRVRTLQFQ